MPIDTATCKDFYEKTLLPGLTKMQTILPQVHCISPDNPEQSWPLHVLMAGTSGTEAEWTYRVQMGNGPAHGLFQFERSGISAVYYNRHVGPLLRQALATEQYGLVPNQGFGPSDIWYYLREPEADSLAVLIARLNYLSDPRPIPSLGAWSIAYAYYVHNWSPGKPSESRFRSAYEIAAEVIASPGNCAVPETSHAP